MIGVSNIAPAIMQFGTPEQKERFLQPMLRGDEIWSQGMSEPDAGSDLASLRTAAVEDGDDFVINGQKTWNSLGHVADWCQLYVRTDPTAKKHAGITCFLVDLRTPGIEARPLTTITGGQTFAELFFTDARIPRSAMLGPLHAGWSVAMTTLNFERAGVARLYFPLANRLDELPADPRAKEGRRDPVLRQRLANVFAGIRCMRYLTERSFADPSAAGAAGSLAKLSWAKCDQELASLAVDLIGLDALLAHDHWALNLLGVRQASIAGGTTEINKTVVGERCPRSTPGEPRIGAPLRATSSARVAVPDSRRTHSGSPVVTRVPPSPWSHQTHESEEHMARVPIEEGFFRIPEDPAELPRLLGSRCPNSRRGVFPRCPPASMPARRHRGHGALDPRA